jgi:hypothetical protein
MNNMPVSFLSEAEVERLKLKIIEYFKKLGMEIYESDIWDIREDDEKPIFYIGFDGWIIMPKKLIGEENDEALYIENGHLKIAKRKTSGE